MMKRAVSFSSYPLANEGLHHVDREFPTDLGSWVDRGTRLLPTECDTMYGYVHKGAALLTLRGGPTMMLLPGMYFAAPGPVSVQGMMEDCEGMIAVRRNYRGVLHVGGPVETKGRLRYIDGCTDSLLIGPQRRGEPCLNLLQFPPGIDQTMHTHPSARAGIVASGRGRCVTPKGDTDLVPGMVFCIHTDGAHKFQTPYKVEMRVIAFHPDSDFGPTDEDHPMLNRTLVEGTSARNIDAIRTRADVGVEYEFGTRQ